MGNSYKQLKTAEIMAKCSGTLSVIGSTWIIVEILRKPRRMRTTLLQILCGMSFYDIGASTWYIIGSWAIPRDTEGNVFMPRGNERTCHMQGFLFQTFASAIPMYNLSLAVYYYLTVNGGWKEDRMKRWWWTFHVPPCTFGLATATYGLAADQFNPNELWCWFSGTEQSDMLKFLLYYGPLWVVFFVIVILFVLMYRHVRKQELATQRHQFEHKMLEDVSSLSNVQLSQMLIASRRLSAQRSREMEAASEDFSSSHMEPSQEYIPDEIDPQSSTRSVDRLRAGSESGKSRSSRRGMINSLRASSQQSRLSRPVFVQGLLFACVFVLTFLFPTLTRAQQLHKDEIRFGTLFCMTLFLPMQGFFNFLVFKRIEIAKFFRRLRERMSRQREARQPMRPLTKSSKTASDITKSYVSQPREDEGDQSSRGFEASVDPTADVSEPEAERQLIQSTGDVLFVLEEEEHESDNTAAIAAAAAAGTAAVTGGAAAFYNHDSDEPEQKVDCTTTGPPGSDFEEPQHLSPEHSASSEEDFVIPPPPLFDAKDERDEHAASNEPSTEAQQHSTPGNAVSAPSQSSAVEEHEQYLAGAILADEDAPEITFHEDDGDNLSGNGGISSILG